MHLRPLVALLFFSFSSTGSAAEIIVRDAGSLRTALRDLKSTTTLRIAAGEYSGGHSVSGDEKLTIISIFAGGIIKVLTDWFLVGIPELNIYGAPIGTFLCYLVMCAVN